MEFLDRPTRLLFFTGKGGVGKTSLSTAAALRLADAGKKVLLVSTDAASNLDEMLGIELRNTPVPVPSALGLSVLNIDPGNAAESYRQRVLAQMGAGASAEELSTVREQLSGACTTEIAAFDEFSSLLAGGAETYDHIVFDTAPTGHTLRLLSLPKAWTGFLDGNDRGASCLGPHSGLKMQESRFKAALDALSDPARTTVILVTRPDPGAIAEARHGPRSGCHAVEHDVREAGRLGTLGDELADLAGLRRLVTVERAQVGLEGRRRRDGHALAVVHELDEDVAGRTGDDKARTRLGAHDLLAKAQVTTRTRVALRLDSHDYLPLFPALRRTTSPAYRTPLPLYGSGLRILRMFAAASPTACFEMPLTVSLLLPSTVSVMPAGASTRTGCEKPRANSTAVPFCATR